MSTKRIAASILAADFAHLADDVNAALAAGADTIHFDVMDHHFVPNLSFGSVICSALRNAGISAPIDVHLMVTNPADHINDFAAAGANLISFHPETVNNVNDVIDQIQQAGLQAGLVFNPDKNINISTDIAKKIDMILLMSVFPGFGGQAFIPTVLAKAKTTRAWLDNINSNATLAIDGGIKVNNIALASQAGIDYFVVGSGLFAADNYEQRIKSLKDKV